MPMTRFDEIFCSFTLYLYLVRESSHKRDGIEKKVTFDWKIVLILQRFINQNDVKSELRMAFYDSHALNSHFQEGKLISQ